MTFAEKLKERGLASAADMEMSRYLKGKLYDPVGITHYSHEEPGGHTHERESRRGYEPDGQPGTCRLPGVRP